MNTDDMHRDDDNDEQHEPVRHDAPVPRTHVRDILVADATKNLGVAVGDQLSAALSDAAGYLTETITHAAHNMPDAVCVEATNIAEDAALRSPIARALVELTDAGRVGCCVHAYNTIMPVYWNLAFGTLRVYWEHLTLRRLDPDVATAVAGGESGVEAGEPAFAVGCQRCIRATTREWLRDLDEQRARAGLREDEELPEETRCDWCLEHADPETGLLPSGIQLGTLAVIASLCVKCHNVELQAVGGNVTAVTWMPPAPDNPAG